MKKLIFIISFLLAIQYGGNVYANSNEKIIEEQEESLGIASFIREATKYTKDTFSDIDINSMYESAISGNIDTSGILNKILNLAGKEIINTLRTLGYILVIIIIHGIIKSVSEGMGNRRGWRGDLLCAIHINRHLSYDELL